VQSEVTDKIDATRLFKRREQMKIVNRAITALIGVAVLVSTADAFAQRPHFGGFGDHPANGDTTCLPGVPVKGLHGYVGPGGGGGTVVNQLGFTCDDGQHERGTFGPAIGTYFQLDCNWPDYAVGLEIRSGSAIDAIGLKCIDTLDGRIYVAPTTAGPYFGEAGGGGGTDHPFSCGTRGEALIGYDSWSGRNIDGIEPICSN
jgi:hypothetical protein